MSVINAVAQLLSAGGDYQISRSVRLRSSASAYFSRTPAGFGASTQTMSFWFKRGRMSGGVNPIRSSYYDANNYSVIAFDVTSNALTILQVENGTTVCNKATVAVYRDPSAWYHVVINTDLSRASGDKNRIYVNGVLQSCTGTDNQVYQLWPYTAYTQVIGYAWASGTYLDGYLAEVNFIDGQALTPSSFGETDAVTGVWKPKKYAGTYGTNGFYLNFSDPSAATAAAIGKDYSGNGNNWTPNNISVTAGTTYDSMIDVPTLGGSGSNHCVLNPLSNNQRGSMALSNGNLHWTNTSTSVSGGCPGTMDVNLVGKVYFEGVPTAIGQSGDCAIGLSQVTGNWATIGSAANASLYDWAASGSYYNAGSTIAAGTFTANDVIMVAYDQSSGKVWFGKNGTWNGSGDPASGTNPAFTISDTTTGKLPFVMGYSSPVWIANFGQRPFAYTPPTGFKALNTQNLPDATIKQGSQYFDATTWTGTGASLPVNVTGKFQPDLVWIKGRSGATGHRLTDSVRGATLALSSDSPSSNTITDTQGVTAFNSGGFTVGSNSNYNTNAATYIGWQWKKGATQGFDITAAFTGTGAAQTVTHSLGVAPSMIILFSTGGTNWINARVYHKNLTAGNVLQFSTTAAQFSEPSAFASISSSSFQTTQTSGQTNIAYCFAEVAGFSRFGSYTGNGSADGPFVHCGFRPRFVLVKRSSNASSWQLFDTSRPGYNANDNTLWADLSSAEGTGTARIDLHSNGFKVRAPSGTDPNVSSATYIYAAFAENPFKNSLAR